MDDQPTEELEADFEEELPEANFGISGTTGNPGSNKQNQYGTSATSPHGPSPPQNRAIVLKPFALHKQTSIGSPLRPSLPAPTDNR